MTAARDAVQLSRSTGAFIAGAATGFCAGFVFGRRKRTGGIRLILNPASLLSEIDLLLDYLLRSRSLFPHMDESMVGADDFVTAPFYVARGYDVHFRFSTPLSLEGITLINQLGHWHNQNFIVRLAALLESRHVFWEHKRIDRGLPGSAEVDVLRRLRNVMAHSSGRYDSTNKRHRRLYRRVKDLFGTTGDSRTATEFPLAIDELLLPITETARRYVASLAAKELRGKSRTSAAPSTRPSSTRKSIVSLLPGSDS